MEATDPTRDVILTFRVNPRERRELQLLARAEGTSRAALLRRLVAERVVELTEAVGKSK